MKYAEDTYLAIPACNVDSSDKEIASIYAWVRVNNRTLNVSKSVEIILFSGTTGSDVVLHHCMHGSARVTSLKISGVTFTDTLFLYTWTMSSTLQCGPCTPFTSCSLTGCLCLLCNRCFALLSFRRPLPAWWGHLLTASVLMLFFVERTNPYSGHRLCHRTFLLLRICAQQPTTNFLL